jgi:predicted outer membrane repeat protein
MITTTQRLMTRTTLRRLLVISLFGLLALVPVLTGTGLARAAGGNATYTVNGATGTDPATLGTCQSTPFKTIGAALACVNGDGTTAATPDTITTSSGTYHEHGLDVNANVAIQAQGGATIDAQQQGRVMTVESGVTVSISGLTITNGLGADNAGAIDSFGTLNITSSTFSNNAATWGGAIYNHSGTLSITSSTLSGNSSSSLGGSIYSGFGTLTITDSTFNNSTSGGGGAIYTTPGTVVTVTDSTFSSNSAHYGGAIYNDGTVTMTANTLSGNSTVAGGHGGAILNNSGTVNISTSTLAGNSASNGGAIANFNAGSTVTITASTISGNSGGAIENQATVSVGGSIIANSSGGGNCSGTITDNGYNLSDDSSCGFTAAKGDKLNTNPQLGPLQDNGGPTWTMALAASSPAIDQIQPGQGGCPSSGTTTDQRGQTRPDSGESNCDIGAYESAYPETTATLVVSGHPSSVTAGAPGSFTVTARDQDDDVATGYTGTVHFTTSDSGTGIVLPRNYTFTAGDNGVHTFSNGVTLVTAGSQTVTATDTASSSITGTAAIQVNPSAASHFTVSAPSTAAVGSAVSVRVTAEDVYGNTATGYGGTVHFTSSDGQASLPADSTLTNGMGTFSVTFKTAGTQIVTASDTGNSWLTGSSGGILVAKATPQISWTTPADITYGTALLAAQLDATASVNGHDVAGTFVYSPAAGTVLNAGKSQTLAVSFTPTDTTDFIAPSTGSVTINVNPAPLTITPDSLTMTYKGTVPAYTWTANFVNGDTSASLTTQPTCGARDGSGNPVSTTTPAGVYPITCTGAGDPNYAISYQTGTLTILYGTGGYLQPVNDTAHGETCGSPCPMSIFKAGQTIPFKFQIKDANGTVVGPDPNPVTFTASYAGTTSNPADESTLTGTPTTGTTFTWTGTMYQYNWKSPSRPGSLWLITATFDNGQTIQVTIGLR